MTEQHEGIVALSDECPANKKLFEGFVVSEILSDRLSHSSRNGRGANRFCNKAGLFLGKAI